MVQSNLVYERKSNEGIIRISKNDTIEIYCFSVFDKNSSGGETVECNFPKSSFVEAIESLKTDDECEISNTGVLLAITKRNEGYEFGFTIKDSNEILYLDKYFNPDEINV